MTVALDKGKGRHPEVKGDRVHSTAPPYKQQLWSTCLLCFSSRGGYEDGLWVSFRIKVNLEVTLFHRKFTISVYASE